MGETMKEISRKDTSGRYTQAVPTGAPAPGGAILASVHVVRTEKPDNAKLLRRCDMFPITQRDQENDGMPNFTPREEEAAELFSKGMAVKQVALKLKISESTATIHKRNIFDKVGVFTILEFVLWYDSHKPKPPSSGTIPKANNSVVSTAEITVKERQIWELIKSGFSNKEISSHIGASLATVSKRTHNLFAKTGVKGRSALALLDIPPEEN